jgi:hypothetical protein
MNINLQILVSKAEEAIRALESFDPYDGNLWVTHLDAEEVDKAITELR